MLFGGFLLHKTSQKAWHLWRSWKDQQKKKPSENPFDLRLPHPPRGSAEEGQRGDFRCPNAGHGRRDGSLVLLKVFCLRFYSGFCMLFWFLVGFLVGFLRVFLVFFQRFSWFCELRVIPLHTMGLGLKD